MADHDKVPHEPEAEPSRPTQQPIDTAIEDWWAAHFPGSAVARSTEAWNVAHAAKEDLKRRLKEI